MQLCARKRATKHNQKPADEEEEEERRQTEEDAMPNSDGSVRVESATSRNATNKNLHSRTVSSNQLFGIAQAKGPWRQARI